MDPAAIAAQLRELAVYYELEGDKHRAFAYDRAARSVEAATGLHRLIEEGRLEELPNVGPSSARIVAELARRGTAEVLDRLRLAWPAVVLELAQLPKVGVHKARKIWKALAPADLEAVAAMCKLGAIGELPGFGKLGEQHLLHAIEARRLRGTQLLLIDAEASVGPLEVYLRADPEVTRVERCGPIRRYCEVVDHVAFAIATADPDAVAARTRSCALITALERRDEGPMVATLTGGMRAELYLAPRARLGWAQICATGSTAHVAQLAARAHDRGVALAQLDAVEEAQVYAALDLPWIPPEVRDGTDEIAAAAAGDDFTDLITLGDLTAATHCHTTYSDGKHTIAEMVRAAAKLGFEAITITDHSAAASYASGLDLAGLRAQHAEIAALVAPAARVLRGIEADILIDGELDVPREILPELDLVIASVHQRFQLDEDAMTARLIHAMRRPHFKIWGHALGRLVLRREPIKVRLGDVLDAVAESRAAIEINGDPHRLDLDPVNARVAAARGIKFVLSSDAHSVHGLEAVRYAVGMARRARIRRSQVLNALPVDELAAAIRPTT